MYKSFDLQSLREIVSEWRSVGTSIALVPTMGNLHKGHLSLLSRAQELADRSVVSIFVNPIQFGEGEDYSNYPSTLEEDIEKLEEEGLDLLFAPNLTELYPGGIQEDTRISVPALSDILCGAFRPGHFSGVATVVGKLLINVQPDYALFGEKDYQQVQVIERMVRDLLFPTQIVRMPIVRETDGLAMSSRNSYLDDDSREAATTIYEALSTAVSSLLRGADIATVESSALDRLKAAGIRPEYFSVRDQDNLLPATHKDKKLVVLTAGWLGGARLIDNLSVDLSQKVVNKDNREN
jgi:pantoate--beta-alanine ligase